MDKIRQHILAAAQPLARTEGWGAVDLVALAQKQGLEPGEVQLCFPRGQLDLVLFHLKQGDGKLLARPRPRGGSGGKVKVREKIATLIWQRLSYDDRELAQKTARFLVLHGLSAPATLWQTADAIWQAANIHDSTFSYYTKRASLALVYSQALLFYLSPQGKKDAATQSFINKEIDLLLKTMSLFNSPAAK